MSNSDSGKKPYEIPRLEKFGTVGTLTLGGGGEFDGSVNTPGLMDILAGVDTRR